jgi:hypothetical protein
VGFIQILPPSKRGTPPCKSGQLKKDLGWEASSARHAARLIIFEIMTSFFVGSGAPVPHRTKTILTRRMMRCDLTSADSGLQLGLKIAYSGVPTKIQPHRLSQPGQRCDETSSDVTSVTLTSRTRARLVFNVAGFAE